MDGKMAEWKKIIAIIWSGQIISTLSSITVGYAVIFWLSTETRSPEVLAFAAISSLLPQLVLGPFAGVLIDRWDRKSIMISADLFVALCSAVMSILILRGETDITLYYILLMFRSVGNAFHIPAMQASVPLLAPESELMRISGVNQIIQSGGIIAGPPLAAFLISVLDMPKVILIDVIGAVIACTSLLLVRIPNPEKRKDAPAPHIFREMKEGLHEIYIHKGLLWLFIVSVSALLFILPIAALFPLMTLDHFGGGTYQVSIIEVAWGVGMLAGGAILGIKKLQISKVILINTMYILLGLSFALSGRLPESGFYAFMVLTFLGGVSMTVYSSAFMVILQTTVEPSAQGRVFSFYGSISLVPSITGLLFTGFLAKQTGVPDAFLIAGILIAVLGIVSFFIPAIRHQISES
jgi:DHA3 family macrolide efflux protein-like MFS transporter